MENKNEGERMLRVPYASPGQAMAILDLLRRISPKEINSKFIVNNEIATPPNAFKVIDFLKWFGIIDAKGQVDESKVQKLKMVGEEKKKFISELIKDSYKELFARVEIQEAKKEDIINFFISHYNFGNSQAKIAASLFIYLCQNYHIPLSKELMKIKKYTKKEGTRKKTSQKGSICVRSSRSRERGLSPEENFDEDILEIKEGEVYIRIPKEKKVISRIKKMLEIYEEEFEENPTNEKSGEDLGNNPEE